MKNRRKICHTRVYDKGKGNFVTFEIRAHLCAINKASKTVSARHA